MNVKSTLLSALEQYRGDDYERAKMAFRGYTAKEMQEYYNGKSGKTRQQILDIFAAHVKNCEEARDYVNSHL